MAAPHALRQWAFRRWCAPSAGNLLKRLALGENRLEISATSLGGLRLCPVAQELHPPNFFSAV